MVLTVYVPIIIKINYDRLGKCFENYSIPTNTQKLKEFYVGIGSQVIFPYSKKL